MSDTPLQQFALVVHDMRSRQKAYFKGKTRALLLASLEAEKRVDGVTKEILDGQTRLEEMLDQGISVPKSDAA